MDKLPPLKVFNALASHRDEDGPYYAEENLLPDWATQFDLLLQILRPWPDSAIGGQRDSLQLWILKPGRQSYERVAILVLDGLITFPRPITLGKEHLEAGVSQIKYEVKTEAGGTHKSEAVAFTIDKSVPLNGQTPPEALIDSELTYGAGVTEDYLNTHYNLVQVEIPVYQGQVTGHEVSVFCGGPDAPPVARAIVRTPDPFNVPGGPTRPTVVSIPDYVFYSLSNTAHMLFYRIASRAGVQTGNAKGIFIRVDLSAAGATPADRGVPPPTPPR